MAFFDTNKHRSLREIERMYKRKCQVCELYFFNKEILIWHEKNSQIHQEIKEFNDELERNLAKFQMRLDNFKNQKTISTNKINLLTEELNSFKNYRIGDFSEMLELLGMKNENISEINTQCLFCKTKFPGPAKKYYCEECERSINDKPKEVFTEDKKISIQSELQKHKIIIANLIPEIEQFTKIVDRMKIKYRKRTLRKIKESVKGINKELKNCPMSIAHWI